MKSKISIKSRLQFATLLLLPITCGLLGFALDQAHLKSLLSSQEKQMTNLTYALMAEAELEGNTLWLPEYLTDDRLNQMSSGVGARIYQLNPLESIWRSQSNVNSPRPLPRSFLSNQDSKTYFSDNNSTDSNAFDDNFSGNNQTENQFVFYHKVYWETDDSVLPFVFAIYENKAIFQQQISTFRQTLWQWFTGFGLLLIGLQTAIVFWGLKPLSKVSEDLERVKNGDEETLTGHYPKELSFLTESINKLIEYEVHQRNQHRNKLSDLAHSIKNPVAIIASACNSLKAPNNHDANIIHDIEEQNERINQIISYQLTRAVGQEAKPFNQSVVVSPLLNKIVSAMYKVYADKDLSIKVDCSGVAQFKGDTGDLMELLGNMIDNACKYGNQKIQITVQQTADRVVLTIEDDGPGIQEALRNQLLKRGARADEALPGQGIGLAVVKDIIDAYQGNIHFDRSQLGGLKAELSFKA